MATIDKVLLNKDTNDEFIRSLMGSVVLATKESNALPQGSDFQYHAMTKSYRDSASTAKKNTIDLIRDICKFVDPERRISDDMEESVLYDQVVDVIDSLLESADRLMSESKPSKVTETVGQALALDKQRIIAQSAQIPKPQNAFLHEIDNDRMNPFRPRLAEKYHAVAPLEHGTKHLDLTDEDDQTVGPAEYFPHPYEHELRNLDFPAWCTEAQKVTTVNPTPTYAQAPFVFVETDAAFDALLSHLAGKTELAIDLEHHSVHTFQGLTCLLQVSSREQDFVVDALVLRRRMKELGRFFADPAVVKVLHGCDKDVLWLQRDLGLYLVNCFDTHVAAKALNYPALSLAHLLKMHCGVSVDKKHQLSDWRVRELPAEMLHYAMEDTHYLLYVYDRMRLELWKKLGRTGLEHVFSATKQLCLTRYEKPRFNPLGYRDLFKEAVTSRSIPKLEDLSSLQEAALTALWDWRDRMAREKDESSAALVSNAELLRIGVHLPRDAVQLEQLCGPLSPYTRQATATVLQILADATSFGPSKVAGAPKASRDTAPALSTPSKARKERPASKGPALPDTVYTFTPAVLSPRATTGPSNDVRHELGSPTLRTDEVFKQAGWSTPMKTGAADAHCDSPLLFETARAPAVSQDAQQRMQRSRDELISDFNTRLNKLVVSPTPPAHQQHTSSESKASTEAGEEAAEQSSSRPMHTVDVGGVALDIPKSFDEVYRLSQRNRQRNKDKQRRAGSGGDGEDGDGGDDSDSMDVASEEDAGADALTGKSGSGKSQRGAGKSKHAVDADFYLNAGEAEPETSVDATLELAQSLNWVRDPAHAAEIREAHMTDLSYQQQQAGGDGSGAASSTDDGSVTRRSSDQGSGKTRRGNRANKTGGGDRGSQPLRSSGDGIAAMGHSAAATGSNKPALPKAFDYSRIPTGAMGALPASAAVAPSGGDGRRGDNSKDKRGGKMQRGAPAAAAPPNPYLFGTDPSRK